VLLAACGGGSGSGGGSAAGLSGVAASGAAVDGTVYVVDSNGVEVNVPVNPDGTFSVSVRGMAPPFMLKVVPNGAGATLYSFVSRSNATINVTPLTTLTLYLTSNFDLEALYTTWSSNTGMLDDASIEAWQEIINANLAALFAGNGIDATFYDFMSVYFNTDGTGIDGVLDALNINIDYLNDLFSVEINSTPLVFDSAIDTSDYNIGDFPIPDNSTWELSIVDSANNINQIEIVNGLVVPNDLSEVEQITESEINGEFYVQGLQTTIAISQLGYDVLGAGDVGTIVSGVIRGTVRVTGTYNNQFIDETVTLNTQFAWERLT
jgi:hypothetical protein